VFFGGYYQFVGRFVGERLGENMPGVDGWLRGLAENLGSSPQEGAGAVPTPVVVVTQQQEPSEASSRAIRTIPRDRRTFRLDGSSSTIVQIIPRGYYDTVWIAIVARTANTQGARPILIHPGKLVGTEGVYNVITDLGYSGNLPFLDANVPELVFPAPPDSNADGVGTAYGNGSHGVFIDMPLTAEPFAVSFSDNLHPLLGTAIDVSVTLCTIRH